MKAPPPLTELKDWITDSLARCRAQRWFGAAFRFDVAQDIVADVARSEAAAGRNAYSAQQEDLEAEKEIAAARAELECALRDGRLDNSDTPRISDAIARLRKARALTHRSGERDRKISEQFAHA